MPIPTGKLIQASFFWKNDKPGGIGFSLGLPGFTSDQLMTMFTGEIIEQYMRDSDNALGTNIVADYLTQLAQIAVMPQPGFEDVLLAAMNIMWLTERGFIPNDEFNGPQFVLAQE